MFKKSVILLAVSSLAIAAQADVLSAGKDTKFEVNVDVGAYYQTTKGATSAADTTDFLGKGLNQIEIKASHKVSDEISVFGEIEIDYDPIGDDGDIKTDDMRVGVASKSFGRISAGQFDNFFEDNVLEALIINRGDAAAVSELKAGAEKGRTIQYTHKLGDLSFALDFTLGRNTAKTDMSPGTALTLAYKLGDFTIAAGHANFGDYDKSGAAQTTDSTSGLNLSYSIGATKLSGLYAISETKVGLKTSHTGAALTTTMGQFGAGIAYQVVDTDNTAKRNEMSISLGYKPFKGMEVFLDLVKFDKAGGQGDTMEVGVKYSF